MAIELCGAINPEADSPFATHADCDFPKYHRGRHSWEYSEDDDGEQPE